MAARGPGLGKRGGGTAGGGVKDSGRGGDRCREVVRCEDDEAGSTGGDGEGNCDLLEISGGWIGCGDEGEVRIEDDRDAAGGGGACDKVMPVIPTATTATHASARPHTRCATEHSARSELFGNVSSCSARKPPTRVASQCAKEKVAGGGPS